MKAGITNKTTNNTVHRFFTVRASALNDNKEKVNGTGHICVVLKPSATNPNNFRAAVSFKSPADKLMRELGVQIAEGRLNSNRPGRNFRVKATNLDEAFAAVFTSMFAKRRKVFRRGQEVTRPFVPDWLHQAAVEQQRKIIALKK